jgi:uncharacterized membrane protein
VLALVLGGGVLMLLLGTQILHWYWLALLGSAATALASFRIRGRLLPQYRVAQMLDQRLQLSDSLSTAWFLLSMPQGRDNAAARFQIEHAEALARTVQPSRAFTFTGQRLWALTGALAAVAFGLFAVRYLVTNSLSLQQALVPVHLVSVFERIGNSLSAENRRMPDPGEANRQQAQSQSAEPQPMDGRSDMVPGEDVKTGKPEGTASGQSQKQKADLPASSKPQEGQSESREGSPGTAQPNAAQKPEASNGDQPQGQQSAKAKEESAAGQEGSSGLLDKMKDALSSLMTKMRPNQSAQKSAQNSERAPEEQKGGDQKSAGKAQQGEQQEARNEQASQEQSSEGQAQGQTTERTQASQGRNSDQSPEKGSDAHSGVGRQDGEKSLKEAEQLRAMGKLAEIIGKRSASVTGEMMVETPSGKQQLKTAYSQRVGRHSDLGGEINRDEIPLMYQQYVREYMEQVHKQGKSNQ